MAAASNTDCFDLPPFESLISQQILEKLEKQIALAKVAAIKASHQEANEQIPSSPSPSSNSSTTLLENGKPLELKGKYSVKVEGDNKISLEATLEYKKLRKEFSKMKLDTREGEDHHESCKTIHETFSEDVDFILNLIRKTNSSLKKENNYFVFKEDIVKASLHLNAEQQLQADIIQKEEKISKLKQEIRKKQIEMSLEEQQKTGEIGRLKDEHHLLKSEANETLKFTDTFFDAHSCNTSCGHECLVKTESEKMAKINQKIDRDVHCLAVMETWTEDFCQQLEAKIEEWRRKLRGDELVMDMRIDAKKRAIKSQQELIKSLNETIAERLEELAPWEEEKEVERQERLAHMRRYYSVRKLQRWWRAHMVKLKLYKRRKVKPIKA